MEKPSEKAIASARATVLGFVQMCGEDEFYSSCHLAFVDMLHGDPDDNILLPADGKKQKHKTQRKVTKAVDVSTLRLRAAQKFIQHLRFIQAACKEAFVQVDTCFEKNKDLVERAQNYKERGITEDRLLRDVSLNVGEGAEDLTIVKLIYGVQHRHELVKLLHTGAPESDAKEEEQSTMSEDDIAQTKKSFLELLSISADMGAKICLGVIIIAIWL